MPPIRETLLRDWGDDLPISGGWGQSREDPIIVLSSDPTIVAKTQMQVLRGIGRGRGVYWRRLSRELLTDDKPGIERLRIESVELTPSEKITQTSAYYFDVSAMLVSGWEEVHSYETFSQCRQLFPFEIGWLHIGPFTNFEIQQAGLGVSVAYSAPGIEATLYVYDSGQRDIPEDLTHPMVQSEFKKADTELKTANAGCLPFPEPPFDGQHLSRSYQTGEDLKKITLLALTTHKHNFVKMRVTWDRDAFIDQVASGWIEAVLRFLGRGLHH